MPSFNKSLIVEQFQRNYLNRFYFKMKIIHSVRSPVHRYGEGAIRTKAIENTPKTDSLKNAVQVLSYRVLLLKQRSTFYVWTARMFENGPF